MTNSTQNFSDPTTAALQVPATSGDAAREVGVSRTTVKAIAIQINAQILKTPGGQWLFPPAAIEKVRQEIQRRERERDR